MGDITGEQFDEYMQRMRESVGLLDRLARNQGKSLNFSSADYSKQFQDNLKTEGALRRKGVREFESDMRGYARGFGDTVRLLDTSSKGLADAFGNLSKKILGGAVVAEVFEHLVSWGEHWTKNYREMANVGQTFNGDLRSMARAAAEAGLPLGDFAEFVKKNSKVMAVFGQKDVAGLAAKVRSTSQQFGMFGYTIEQMNDLTGDYLDMQRMMGNRVALLSGNTTSAVQLLAKNATALASTFGESRDEIMKRTKETMESPNMMVAMGMHPELKGSKSIMSVGQALSAVPGQAGGMLTQLFSTALQGRAFMNMSDEFQQLIKLGPEGQQIGNLIASLADTAKANPNADGLESTAAALQQIQKIVNDPSFAVVAGIQGQNDPALKALYQAFVDGLRGIDLSPQHMKVVKDQLDRTEKTTAALLSLDNALNTIKGSFYDKLLAGIGDDQWSKVGDVIGNLTHDLTQWVATLDPKAIETSIDQTIVVVEKLAKVARHLFNATASVYNFFVWLTQKFPGGGVNKDGTPSTGASAAYGAIGTILTYKFIKKLTGWGVKKGVTGTKNRIGRWWKGGGDVAGAVEDRAPGGSYGEYLNKATQSTERAAGASAERGMLRTLMEHGGKASMIALALGALYEMSGSSGGKPTAGGGSSILPGDTTSLLQMEVTEQKRTNELLEALLSGHGISVPGGGGSGGQPTASAILGAGIGFSAAGVAIDKAHNWIKRANGPLPEPATSLGGRMLEGAKAGAKENAIGAALWEVPGYLGIAPSLFGAQKALSLKNLAKSGIRIAGSTAGGFLGAGLGSLVPVAGTAAGAIAGGVAGGVAGDWLADTLFGADDVKHKAVARAPQKAASQPISSVSDPVATLIDLNTRQLNNLRAHTQVLQDRLPPIEMPKKNLEIQATIHNDLQQILRVQENIAVMMNQSVVKWLDPIHHRLEEIRDHVSYPKR